MQNTSVSSASMEKRLVPGTYEKLMVFFINVYAATHFVVLLVVFRVAAVCPQPQCEFMEVIVRAVVVCYLCSAVPCIILLWKFIRLISAESDGMLGVVYSFCYATTAACLSFFVTYNVLVACYHKLKC